MTTSPTPTPTINGHDLLRSLGKGIEGPVLWGRPIPSNRPGVFVVELPAPQTRVSVDPNAIREWLERVPDLGLDGKRPSVAELQTRLASFWVPNQVVLYIGSSTKSVAARLAGMYKTPLGERRPLSVGYWLKTLHDLKKARIWWVETQDAELYEDSLLDEFHKQVGALPYAVLTTPAGERRAHGLTSAFHDDEPAKAPARPARVTVLPDGTEETLSISSVSLRSKARPAKPAAAKPAAAKPAPRKTVRPPQVGPSAIVIEKPRRTAASKAAAAIAPTTVHCSSM